MSHAEDDDFVVSDFVKNQVRIWAGNKTTHALVARPVSSVWMFKCQMDKPLNASLHFLRALRRPLGDIAEHVRKIRQSTGRVAKFQRPYLAQRART